MRMHRSYNWDFFQGQSLSCEHRCGHVQYAAIMTAPFPWNCFRVFMAKAVTDTWLGLNDGSIHTAERQPQL